MAGAVVAARQDFEAPYREHGNRLWWALVAFAGDRDIASDAEAEAFAYLIELNDRHTILLTTEGRDNTVGDGTRTQDVLRVEEYEANRAVMDQMVRTIRFSV